MTASDSARVINQFKHYPYLISKWLDPLLAVGMDVSAYYLYEKRVGRPEGHTLNELLLEKLKKMNVL